jgi:acetyl-CoA carboxylase biotin carboxyl carrier protein
MIFQNKEDIIDIIDKFEKSTLARLNIEIEGQIKISLNKKAPDSSPRFTHTYMPPPPPPYYQNYQPEAASGGSAVPMPPPPAAEASAVIVNSINVDSAPAENPADSFIVKAPLVGTYYSASSPESPTFAEVGKKVKKGDVLCIIETMKLMNEIIAEQDGEIVDICIKNGDIAEFGQVLFKMY